MAYTKNTTVDSWDTARQLDYYKANPNEARQEIARAQGIGGSAASNWASQLQSVAMPQAAPKPTPAPSSNSGSSNPWQSYNPPAMSQSYSPPPAPSTAKVNMPQYSAPSSYSGPSSVIGNTSSFGSDMNKGYQSIYDSVRAADPTRNQINTWADKGGNVYDTTKMTAQQIFAMSLNKDNNPKAADILKGMGLDMNGNPTSPMPTYSFGGGNMPMSASQVSSIQGMPSAANYSSASVNAPPPPAYTKNANVDAMSTDQQLAYYKANPAEAQQEIARAQGVGGAAAMNWANQIRGILPQGGQTGKSNSVVGQQGAGQPQVGQTPNGGFFPAPANPYGSISPAQIQAQAAAKVQAQIADRSRIASQTKSGYQSSFDRLKSTTNDSRTLENVQNARNLNPFSGRSDYAQGMIARERETTDRQNQQDLQTRLGGVDSQLADFLNQTPDMQQQIINDMTKQERDYFLETNAQAMQAQQNQITNNRNASNDAAANTGYYNPSGMNADQINQEIAKNSASYLNSTPEVQQQLHARNVYLNGLLGKTDSTGNGDYAGGNPNGNVGYKTVAGQQADIQAKTVAIQQEGSRLNNEIAKLELANYPQEQKLKILQLQKQIANIGAAPYQSATDAEYDRVKLETAKQQLELLKNPNKTAKPKQPDDYKTDPNFASDMAYMKSNPSDASKLDSNAQAFIDAYGYDGYLALRKSAGLD